jgi:hypothetical protein
MKKEPNVPLVLNLHTYNLLFSTEVQEVVKLIDRTFKYSIVAELKQLLSDYCWQNSGTVIAEKELPVFNLYPIIYSIFNDRLLSAAEDIGEAKQFMNRLLVQSWITSEQDENLTKNTLQVLVDLEPVNLKSADIKILASATTHTIN